MWHIQPDAIALNYTLAFLLQTFNIYTTTYVQYRSSLRYLRLFLAIPTLALWWACAWPPPRFAQEWATVFYTAGAYWGMQTWDVCVTGFFDKDEDVPRWVLLKRGDGDRDKKGRAGRVALRLPTTFLGRLAYAVDYIFAVRGGSAFKDHAFSWALDRVVDADAPTSYGHFVLWEAKAIIYGFLVMDFVGHFFIFCRSWDLTAPYPITSLPFIQQIPITLAIGNQIYFTSFFTISLFTILAVPLLRMHPETWSQYWWSPHTAYSLEDLWSRRWHATFHRVFHRISLPILTLIRPYVGRHTRQFVRAFLIFGLSAAYHAGLPLAVKPYQPTRYLVFWEWSMISCFMFQPFGLLLEAVVIHPATERLPGKWKVVARRTYLWAWLIWTGRYFCDSYLSVAMLPGPVLGDYSPSAFITRAAFGL